MTTIIVVTIISKAIAIFFFQLEHPFSYFSKVGFPVIMSEEEIQGIYSYDPWYSIHYKNLQDETIKGRRAQDTYLSNYRKKQKARDERKRVEKEEEQKMLVLG